MWGLNFKPRPLTITRFMAKKKTTPFIVIEALDAGGSQTQTDLLVRRLKKEKNQVLQLHFPQEDRATGRMVYDKFLLYKNKQPFSRREQALLYIQDFFSRQEDMQAALAKQTIVVSDRFCTSTLAYQTMGLSGAAWRKMYDWIWWLCFQGTPVLPRPTSTVFLDTPVAVSLQRLQGKKKDFFETKEKLTRIRNAYHMVASEQQWQVIMSVDQAGNERTREDIHQEIWQLVAPLVR